MFARILVALLLLLPLQTASAQQESQFPQTAWAAACEDWDDWDKPAPPFNIFGNSWYVGTCGISAILITSDDGHILIDGASRDGGPLVEANIAKLGFRIEDVKILLHSHEHFDHVGGLAYLQKRSGAMMIASAGAMRALRTGEAQPDDPQYGMHEAFEPVDVSIIVGSSNPVTLGHITLTPLETPGHTPGGLSWQWEEGEGDVVKSIVYADSLSPVSSDDYRFSDHPEYVAAYRESLARVAALDCEVLLTPHPSASGMRDKLAAGDLTSGMNCREFAASVTARLDARLSQEAAPK